VFQVEFEVFRTMVISGWDPLDDETVYFDTREQAFRRNMLFYGTVKMEAAFFPKCRYRMQDKFKSFIYFIQYPSHKNYFTTPPL
jgi:hypothetical protein